MDYIEWIRTIGLAINLLIRMEFDSTLTVVSEWKQSLPAGLFTSDSSSVLYLSFLSKHDNSCIAGLCISPWDNLFPAGISSDNIIFPQYQLFTVSEYSIVFLDRQSVTMGDHDRVLFDNLISRLKVMFGYDDNQTIISEQDGISTPQGIQIISRREFKYYIEENVAQPGSKMTMMYKAGLNAPGKMVLRHLVPDIGSVKSQWLFPESFERNECITLTQDYFIKSINVTIDDLLRDTTCKINDRCQRFWSELKAYLDTNNCGLKQVQDYYLDHLQKILLCKVNLTTQSLTENIFGDYQPKLTPDELYDFLPAIYDEIIKLPDAEFDNLQELLLIFKKYSKLARRSHGKWVDGNVILGANPREYQPSYEELMLSATGERIQIITGNLSGEQKENITNKRFSPRMIKFVKFSVIHMDVMGSGRFFYIGSKEEVKFGLY